MSPRRVAAVLAAAGVISLIVIALIAVPAIRRHAQDRALRRTLDLVPGVLLHARGFHWTQMKGDRKQWELSAREASYSNDKTSLKLRQPELLMVLDDGKTLLLHAASAELKLSGNHIDQAELGGGLELKYGDVALSTTAATFVPDRDLLEAPGPVEVRSPDFDVSGIGLEAHPRARLFEVQSQVSTRLKLKPGSTRSHKS